MAQARSAMHARGVGRKDVGGGGRREEGREVGGRREEKRRTGGRREEGGRMKDEGRRRYIGKEGGAGTKGPSNWGRKGIDSATPRTSPRVRSEEFEANPAVATLELQGSNISTFSCPESG
eukprot:7457683-Pyramimonas_sp.AAC.1